MDASLLNILVCPSCHAPLIYDKKKNWLICKAEKLAYPIIDEVPVMLVEKARRLTLEEVKHYG